MAASWMKLAFAVGIAGSFATLIPSCADNNVTLFIRQVQALIAPECIVNSDATALTSPAGFVDVGIAANFVLHPLIGNQLLIRGDNRTDRAEPNRVQIEGAEIELVEPSGAAIALGGVNNPYTVIATGTIDPTASTDATYGVTQLEVLPPKVIAEFRRQLAAKGIGATETINARITVFGRTLGGTAVETGVFTYPITTCYGCGVSVPAEAVDPKISGRNCKGTSAAGSSGAATRTVCRLGQDAPTDCRYCQGTTPLCTPCSTDPDCASMVSPITGATSKCNAKVGFCE
jgi:hypothetical protein